MAGRVLLGANVQAVPADGGQLGREPSAVRPDPVHAHAALVVRERGLRWAVGVGEHGGALGGGG